MFFFNAGLESAPGGKSGIRVFSAREISLKNYRVKFY